MSWFLLLSVFGVLVVACVLVFAVVRKSDQAASTHLGDFAKKLGLTYDPGSIKQEPSLTGVYKGIPIVVQSVVASSGASLIYTTTYTLTLSGNHIPLDLVVYREGILSKVGKVFGTEDIQLGDPDLDEAFIIKGSAHHDARKFFAQPNVRTCFLDIHRRGDTFRLEDKCMIFDLPHRLLEEADRLQSHIDRLVVYARVLNNAGIPTDSSDSDLLGESTTLEVFIPQESEFTTSSQS